MNANCCRASALCEEFSDYVISDDSSESVLVNIDEEYFTIIYKELRKIGYVLVFKYIIDGLSNRYKITNGF